MKNPWQCVHERRIEENEPVTGVLAHDYADVADLRHEMNGRVKVFHLVVSSEEKKLRRSRPSTRGLQRKLPRADDSGAAGRPRARGV